MAPQCDSLEDNAEGFGAKKKKKKILSKKVWSDVALENGS